MKKYILSKNQTKKIIQLQKRLKKQFPTFLDLVDFDIPKKGVRYEV